MGSSHKSLTYLALTLITFSEDIKSSEKDCIVCRWPTRKVIDLKSNTETACENLYQAACLDSNGKNNYPEYQNWRAVIAIKRKIAQLRDETFKSSGFKSQETFIIWDLSRKGVDLKVDMSEKAKKYFFEQDSSSWVEPKEIFSSVKTCEADKESIKAELSFEKRPELTQAEALASIEKANKLLDERRDKEVKLYAMAIPAYVDLINQKCKTLKALNDGNKVSETPEEATIKSQVCDQTEAIRNQAVDLFRRRNEASAGKKAEEFVNRYKAVLGLSSIPISNREMSVGELTAIANRLVGGFDSFCLTAAEESVAERQQQETLELTAKSKTVVEGIIDYVYSGSRKEKLKQMYEMVAEAIYKLLGQTKFAKDQMKLINDDYKKIELGWLTKPDAKMYKKDLKLGVDILDLNYRNLPPKIGATLESFEDPTLRFFYTPNASFVPHLTYGKTELMSTVNIMPVFLETLEENPWNLYYVLSHEAGHNIGPKISVANKYEILDNYRELLACYSSPDSIGMRNGQEDETTADYIAAEVIAQGLEQLPLDQRVSALFSAVDFGCLSEAQNTINLSADDRILGEVHPSFRLRVGGIIGATKSIRNKINCKANSKTFRSCSLEGTER